MNKYLIKLLRQHVSKGQLAGFFFANLFGMVIVLLSIQFYADIKPLFTQSDSFLKKDYIVVSKKISTLGSLAGKNTTFSSKEIETMRSQPFTQHVAPFTSSEFDVYAGLSMEGTGMQMSTAMFFESVPDEFVDVQSDHWTFNAQQDEAIPIIIPRNYLNLYNFGFAQSRNLPKLSESVLGLVNMNITLRGNGEAKRFKGNIVGFSNRLNTILVPQAFMDWANHTFAPHRTPQPSRLIVEVKNPADAAIAQYFRQKGYETEDNKLDAGKTTYFLNLVVGIVLTVGLVISVLSFYILMLSIFLLLQKNTTKLESLLLIGYSPSQVARPYQVLTAGLNFSVLLLAMIVVVLIRGQYMEMIDTLNTKAETGSTLLTFSIGTLIFAVVSCINIMAINRKVKGLYFR